MGRWHRWKNLNLKAAIFFPPKNKSIREGLSYPLCRKSELKSHFTLLFRTACLYLLLLPLLVWCVCLEWRIFPASHPEPLPCPVRLLSAQVSQWATVIYCPNSAVLCQRLWSKRLTLQLVRISSLSLMFFFTFLQILFYEPIACYLPDTEAEPKGIIFSPLSQRVASLMLGLKSLEQLHIGYSTLSPQGSLLRWGKFPAWFKLAFRALLFCFVVPAPGTTLI